MRWRSAARPSISGISTSSVTTSGCVCSTLSSASSPLIAWPATSMSGSAAIASLMIRRMNAESSTTSTRIGIRPSPADLRQDLRERGEDSIGLHWLEHKVLRAVFERLHDDGLLAHGRDHGDARIGIQFPDLLQRG